MAIDWGGNHPRGIGAGALFRFIRLTLPLNDFFLVNNRMGGIIEVKMLGIGRLLEQYLENRLSVIGQILALIKYRGGRDGHAQDILQAFLTIKGATHEVLTNPHQGSGRVTLLLVRFPIRFHVIGQIRRKIFATGITTQTFQDMLDRFIRAMTGDTKQYTRLTLDKVPMPHAGQRSPLLKSSRG